MTIYSKYVLFDSLSPQVTIPNTERLLRLRNEGKLADASGTERVGEEVAGRTIVDIKEVAGDKYYFFNVEIGQANIPPLTVAKTSTKRKK